MQSAVSTKFTAPKNGMSEVHQILNSVGTALAILGIIWLSAVKLTKLEVKVETMWGMLLKRAVVEGVHKGLMEVHSPVRLINDSGKMLENLAPELKAFYEKNCKGMNESEVALAIERAFGARLAKEVCIPNGISFGICIIIALAIVKGDESLTEILDNSLPINEHEREFIRHGEDLQGTS